MKTKLQIGLAQKSFWSNPGLTLILILFVFTLSLNGQDKITLKDGTELTGKVFEINDMELKYKSADNISGPVKVLSKSEIFMVKYENGTREVFKDEPIRHTVMRAPQAPPVNPKFESDSSDFARIRRKRFGGPRVGFTYIGQGTAATYLSEISKTPFITQFGWQFEARLFTVEDLSGIVEFIPLIGGVEQGMFIPSASVLIGLRGGHDKTFEFALGPNFSVVPDYLGHKRGSVGLVLAVGTSFSKGNINFPINLAVVPSVGSSENVFDPATGNSTKKSFQTGWRVSLVVGFNSRKK